MVKRNEQGFKIARPEVEVEAARLGYARVVVTVNNRELLCMFIHTPLNKERHAEADWETSATVCFAPDVVASYLSDGGGSQALILMRGRKRSQCKIAAPHVDLTLQKVFIPDSVEHHHTKEDSE